MTADILGPGFTSQRLDLPNGEFATLIRREPPPDAKGAVLYLHGFVDYFFHAHLADLFTDAGYAFYAIDLRHYGRSIVPGREAWYTAELRDYLDDLDAALAAIRADGHQCVIGMAHSTGGLIMPMWAHARREQRPLAGMILNSPWLDLQEPWFTRTVGTWIIRAIGRIQPRRVIPQRMDGMYPQTIHVSQQGEWAFNPEWKPLTPTPVRFGFLASVRREQARLHRGWDLGIPVLMLRSTRSRLDLRAMSEEAFTTDLILDVSQMERWLPCLGSDVVDAPIEDAMHDVMLSHRPVREAAADHIRRWLAARFGERPLPERSADLPTGHDTCLGNLT